MVPIVCDNDLKTVLRKLQEYTAGGGIIGGMYLADSTEKQVIVLVSESPINEELANIWWSGYLIGMKNALE